MGDAGRYEAAAQVAARTAWALFNRLQERGTPFTHAEAVQLTAAAMPTIATEILADPEIMEPEEEVQ